MRCLLNLILLAVVTVCPAAPLRTVTAQKVSTPVVIDGDLSEATWQAGAWNGSFVVLDQPSRKAAPQTRFKVAFDDRYLYFAAEADEPSVGTLKTAVTARDGKVYNDDCLEFMVDPTGQRVE
ncbi:MAG: carbohydrate-binding family 9-like protein, partial [Armatimonadia bacterium]